jgi:hypothetical protein
MVVWRATGVGDVTYWSRKDRGGGAETLGEDELLYDDDPWTETHLVTTLSLAFLDEKLGHLQGEKVSTFNRPF